MREWLTVIVALLILAVVLDGIRRMRLTRRSAIRMPPNRTNDKGKGIAKERAKAGDKERDNDMDRDIVKERAKGGVESNAKAKRDPETYGSELPNGGARVVNVRKPGDAQQLYTEIRQTREEKMRRVGRPNRIPQQVALNLDEHVPTLMEVEQEEQQAAATTPGREGKRQTQAKAETVAEPQQVRASDTPNEKMGEHLADAWDDERIEPRLSDENMDFDEETADRVVEAAATVAWRERSEDKRPLATAQTPYAAGPDDHLTGPDDYVGDPDDYVDDINDDTWQADANYAADDRAADLQPQAIAEESDFREPEEVLVINVMGAHGSRFRGDILLETVLEQGMRFGSMNIFHHHEHFNGEGGILYSMANIVVPGTFDLATMKEFSTPGVSLFLALPVDGDSSKALAAMVGTAKAIAARMGGELKDENRSVMTAQTIEHYRSRIKEFERKQLSQRKASLKHK